MSNQIRNGIHKLIINEFSKLNIDKNAKILDIGCGNGGFLKQIKNKGYHNLRGTEGYDIDHRVDSVNIQRHIFTDKLDFNENTFDVIFILDLIEHIPNQYVLLDEIHRILKKGGYIILSTPNIYSILGKLSFLFSEKLYGFKNANVDIEKGYAHINPFIPNIFEIQYKHKFKIITKKYF